jgi:hypothetical protein
MNLDDVKQLTDSGIQAELEDISREQRRAVMYKGLHDREDGKFLVEDMKQRISHIRKLYSCIPPSSPQAQVLLAVLQANEHEVEQWVNRIELNDRLSAVLEVRMAGLRQELAERKKRRECEKLHFLPEGYKSKREGSEQ